MAKEMMRFEGGKELMKALDTLSARVSKSVIRDALETAAEPMRRRMSEMAPREPGAPDLADNIVISTSRVKRAGMDGQASAIAVGPEKRFFYGRFQEFGTVHHSAQPFMRPAFDGGVRKAVTDVARALWTALASRGVSRSVISETPIDSGGPFQ